MLILTAHCIFLRQTVICRRSFWRNLFFSRNFVVSQRLHENAKADPPFSNRLTKYLLDRGATVGIKGLEDLTPLHVALRHPDIVMLLLHRQADVHARSSAQRTPLHMSAAAGIAQTCDVLINLHGAQLDARDSDSKTPLQVAVEAQQTEIVNLLLSRMNLKPKDPTFTAALFAAIETGNARMAEVFFQQGASLRSLGENSYKPATLTAKSGSVTMLELMISRKCKLKEVIIGFSPFDESERADSTCHS